MWTCEFLYVQNVTVLLVETQSFTISTYRSMKKWYRITESVFVGIMLSWSRRSHTIRPGRKMYVLDTSPCPGGESFWDGNLKLPDTSDRILRDLRVVYVSRCKMVEGWRSPSRESVDEGVDDHRTRGGLEREGFYLHRLTQGRTPLFPFPRAPRTVSEDVLLESSTGESRSIHQVGSHYQRYGKPQR